jgi:hypothetical protein
MTEEDREIDAKGRSIKVGSDISSIARFAVVTDWLDGSSSAELTTKLDRAVEARMRWTKGGKNSSTFPAHAIESSTGAGKVLMEASRGAPMTEVDNAVVAGLC